MAGTRHSRAGARWLVVAGSLLAGFGIWASVTKASLPSVQTPPDQAVSLPSPIGDKNFGANDAFLTQPSIAIVSDGGRYYSAPPAVSPAPTQSLPAQPSPRPRLRTRGS